MGRADRLGRRLKQHLNDRHAGKWDRFSWFGFRPVLKRKDQLGLQELKILRTKAGGRMHQQIGELEALLIRALGLESNYAKMKFPSAKPWVQVKAHEVEAFLMKVARPPS